MTWALSLTGMRSSEKFVLVCLANYANEQGICYPSVAQLSEDTCQDRKTVLSNLESLRKSGHITDTGKRVGTTKQVIVYAVNSAKNGSDKQSQNRDSYNSTENGTCPKNGTVETVPFFPETVPFFRETVPKTGHGSLRNPQEPKEEQRARQYTDREPDQSTEPPKEIDSTMRRCGELAKVLREEGMTKVTWMTPTLTRWVQDGFTVAKCRDALHRAKLTLGKSDDISAGYVDKILRDTGPRAISAVPPSVLPYRKARELP